MPAKSAITNAAAQLTTNATGNTGDYGLRLLAAPENSNTVYFGFANTVTLPLANGNTTGDGTVGYPLKAGEELYIPKAQFVRYGISTPNAAAVYVIATAANQRVFFELQ